MLKINKLIVLILLSTLISACHFNSKTDNWPEDIPPRAFFVDAYDKQVLAGTNETNLETHLKWVKRFYRGLAIYPGWNEMTEMVLNSLSDQPSEVQKETEQRLNKLGENIVVEWAQSNDKRNINSANINTWGNALRTSVKRKQQLSFLSLVEADVDALIARQLNPSDIKAKRYYPPEELDDF